MEGSGNRVNVSRIQSRQQQLIRPLTMFGGENLPFGRHSDVLNAFPSDSEELVRLVEELKRRGNAAFAKKSYEEADALYSKAIEVNSANPLLNQHIFHANRSATRAAMNKFQPALEDAQASVSFDPTYAKSYFRMAQAFKGLKQYKEALVVLETAREMEPDNKSVTTLAKQLEELAANHVEEAVAKPAATKVTRVEEVKETVVKSTTTTEKVVIDDEEIVGHVRGYKKTADGRTTTFFNNELTDEAKRLIGDIAPKKVEDPNKVQIKSVEGGSAWNQGNTFEEKDMTSWAKDQLSALLADIRVQSGSGVVRVTDVKDLAGEASIAVVRGKKRYIFDFTFALAVVGELNGAEVTGELKFLDVSSDADGDYDVDVSVPSRYTSDAGKALHAELSAASSPIRSHVASQLASFVTQYQTF